jgi:hypothetical protein
MEGIINHIHVVVMVLVLMYNAHGRSMCIQNLYDKIKTKLDNNGFHDDCLPFLQHIKACATDETPPVTPYIDHCCITDVQYQHDLLEDHFHNQPPARKIPKKLTHTNPITGISVGGLLCYDIEFRLLTPISLTEIDILASRAKS